ncbi:MAG: hypothetical protein AAFP99_10100, partial [Pseudomonadota bacterium]
MADEQQKPEDDGLDFNPKSRDALKKAADELLKADRTARKRAAAESADDFSEFENVDTSAFANAGADMDVDMDAYPADAD